MISYPKWKQVVVTEKELEVDSIERNIREMLLYLVVLVLIPASQGSTVIGNISTVVLAGRISKFFIFIFTIC